MPAPSIAEEDDEEQQETDEPEDGETIVDEGGDEEEVEETEDDEEEVEVEEADLPDDDDDDDDGGRSSGLLAGSTFGISNKALLFIGIAAVLLVLWLRSVETDTTTKEYTDEDVEDELEEGGEELAEQDVTDAGGSAERFNEQAQDAAINELFDG